MTENSQIREVLRAKRSKLMGQLHQLATQMEDKGLNKSTGVIGLQNNDEQLRITQYKMQAGKLVFELYKSGECSSGVLHQVLSYWSKTPYLESTDWNYVQGFESICWQWYGDRFSDLKKESGELCAYAHVIRLLMGEFAHQDID